MATLHGDNLADTPYEPPAGLLRWLDLASGPGPHRQRDSGVVLSFPDLEAEPRATTWKPVRAGAWSLHGAESLHVSGQLLGGCIETMCNLAGTRYGDVAEFGRQHADDGLIVYLEAAGDEAATICRNLHGLRLARWFDDARAVLMGRTSAPDHPEMTQRGAVLDALGPLDLPLVFDVEIGHVPPHLPLVNGASLAGRSPAISARSGRGALWLKLVAPRPLVSASARSAQVPRKRSPLRNENPGGGRHRANCRCRDHATKR